MNKIGVKEWDKKKQPKIKHAMKDRWISKQIFFIK